MSQFYKNVEPNIIDNEMVQKVIEKKCPEDLLNFLKAKNITFKDVTELQLSFKSILQIDNLWYLENLTKLQLDNNFIEKIEALESLVHLVWLDLSFNNIEVIEGLDTLVKLQDLSLYSNRISKIENMDTLQELQIFSIGKNNLTSLEDVVYLRKFKNLQTLNLSGNPLCDGEQYMLFVVAHLPKLVYLDFKLVRDTMREAALLKFRDHIKPLEKDETRALALLELKQEKQKELQYHEAAFVEHLNGSWLFDSLYAEDTEAAKLASLPGMEDLLQAYRDEFVSVGRNLYKYGLKEYEKRKTEVSDFYEKRREALIAGQEENRKVVQAFENRNKKRLDEIRHARSDDIAESKRAECKEDILQLWHVLMTLETLVCNELEKQLKDFKRSIDVIASTFIENIKEMIAQCQALENQHHEKLMEIALTTMEKCLLSELEEELPDDVRKLILDKDTLVNAINTSHGIRLRKIDKRESDILCNTYHWHTSVIEKAFQTESDRNRACLKKIISYIKRLQEELDDTKTGEPME